MLRDRLTALCSLYSSLGGFLDACLFKSRYLNYLAAEALKKLAVSILSPFFLTTSHHVDSNDDGNAELGGWW